ncbi:MAG: response regulator [Pseudomonadota bacterium]
MTRILIIDDDDQIRRMLCRMLTQEGYAVDDAADGAEGISRFRKQPYDLVLTDLIMPEKEGIEMIIELKSEFPDVKIIAMSGGARMGPEAYLQLADSLGAERCFSKPIPRAELLGAISALVGPARSL